MEWTDEQDKQRKEQYAMRTPARVSNAVLEAAVDEYLCEVRRIQRLVLQQVVTDTCNAEGVPVFEGDEMEAHIDVLEALIAADNDDPAQIHQLIDELAWSPEGKLSSEQIVLSLQQRLVEATPTVTDDATLDQYHFQVTGRISTRCKQCRRGRHWTEQEFRHNRFLQRVLVGDQVPCSFCQTGQLKVYGVIAVRHDNAHFQESHEPPKKKTRKKKKTV